MQQHYIDRSEEDLERRLAARFDPTRKRGRLDAQMSGEGMDSAENLARALQRSGMDRGSRRRRAAAIGCDEGRYQDWPFHARIMKRARLRLKSRRG